MSETWTIVSCYRYTGDISRVSVGDQLTLDEGPAPYLTIVHGRAATILDVHLGAAEPGRPDRRFPRESARNRNLHPDSDLYRGNLLVMRDQNGCDVLQLTLGFKGHGTGDDDDTEIVVATKPATK